MQMQEAISMDQNKIIRVPALTNVTGVSISTISRMEKRGEFPQRRRIGVKTVGWLESEVMEWLYKQEQISVLAGNHLEKVDRRV